MSELRRLVAITSIISGILIFLGVGIWLKADDTNKALKLNGSSFATETVQDNESRKRGLSGRDALASDSAMVFIFDRSEEQCFWMKDMKFSIDIVWLDASNRVVSIEKGINPNSFPQNYCHEGLRVIEFKAGTADKLNLKIGDQAYL